MAHIFENVNKFEIRDFDNKGYPQIGLWRDNSENPSITDLSVSCTLSSSNPVEQVLISKLRVREMIMYYYRAFRVFLCIQNGYLETKF